MNKTVAHNPGPELHDPFKYTDFKFYSTNPSNQHRLTNYGLPNLLAPYYNQNILTDNPSNVIYYSGTSGIPSDPRIELPNTGEYFNFLDSEADVYRNVVGQTLGVPKESAGIKSDKNPKVLPAKGAQQLNDNDKELFDSLKTKLTALRLKEHPCDVCAKNGHKSLFHDDETDLSKHSLAVGFPEPCPHSTLKNVPLVYSLSKFDEDPADWNKPQGASKDYKIAKLCTLAHVLNQKDEVKDNYDPEKVEKLNLDELNVDHLLTYNHNKSEPKDHEPKEIRDISQFVKTKNNLNDLTPIKTNALRNVASDFSSFKENNKQWADKERLENLNHEDIPIVTLKEKEVDQNGLDLWVYPKCLEAASTYRDSLPSDRKHRDIVETTKEEDEEFKEIQEYLRNNEMSVDFMLQKYINLRKANTSKEALRALKHLICLKLNKQKLYYKGTDPEVSQDESQDNIFDKVLSNITKSSPLKDTDFVREDVSTLYTYSSLSLSTYDSIMEDVTLEVMDNDFFYDAPTTIHTNTLDAYGWLTVTDESERSSHRKILYSELVGNKFYFYTASYKANFKSINTTESFKTVVLDQFFTMVRKTEPKTNKSYLRIHGTEIQPKDDTTKSTSSRRSKIVNKTDDDTSFLKVEADTHNELLNWHMFLGSRSRISSFFTVLEKHGVIPLNNTIYFLLYPKRMELLFNRLTYNNECEEDIYQTFIKQPLNYIDFSMRNMTDKEFLHHMMHWNQPMFTANFSHNNLNFSFDMSLLIDYVKDNLVERLILDKNPLSEPFLTVGLASLAVKTTIKYISVRGCTLYPSLIVALKRINKSKEFGVLVLDLRQCQLTPELHEFATGYPLNNLEIIIQDSPTHVREHEMEYFMDTKDLSDISRLGSLISGRLLSTQWRVRQTFKWPFSKKRSDDAIDVYFEYKAPYLVWHNWFPKNKRFIFSRKKEDPEQGSNLTESQAVFVKDAKLMIKEDVNWLMIHGRVPDNFKSQTKTKDMKVIVKGYTDKATQRWLEIFERWIAGITYVDYLRSHSTALASRHILCFCSRIDAPELVMNGFPPERKLMMRFLSYLSGQSSLKSISFSNMGLDANQLSFDRMVIKDLKLAKLDFSFNQIDMEIENMWLMNALVPKVTVDHYNISRNPLGDSLNSCKLFFRVLALSPKKISFNFCKLGNNFLTKLTGALGKVQITYESVEIIELEGNEFGKEEIERFINALITKFPNLFDLRLDGSIKEENIKKLEEFNSICNFEKVSKDEPDVGDITRVLHVKKEKQTTRQSYMLNRNNPTTQF